MKILKHLKEILGKNIFKKIRPCTRFKLALGYSVNPYDSKIVKEALATQSLLLTIVQIKRF